MSGSIFCWTAIAALAHLCYASTASSDTHICTVVSIPLETNHTTLIKFDFIRFPYKAEGDTISSAADVITLYLRINESIPATQESHSSERNISSPNDTTSTVATQQEYTSSTMNTPTQPTGNSRCKCHLKSDAPFVISIFKVWYQSHSQHPTLQLSNSSTGETYEITESWNQTLNNKSVTLSIADDVSLSLYGVILEVTGNLTSVTCTGSMGAPPGTEAEVDDGANKQEVLSANAELIFETPLLIIGAVLAVIGSLLIIIGIAVMRRYRKKRKRLAGYAKAERDSDKLSQCNYEMITYETEACVTSDSVNPPRKSSASSLSHSEKHHKDSVSSIRTYPRTTQAPSIHPAIKPPTSGTREHKTMSFISVKKGKHNNNNHNKCEADKDDGDYSEVEQDYEDICEDPPHELSITRIATPLAFLKPGDQKHMLKKTHNLSIVNAKTRTLPTTQLDKGNTYSHLDRTGNVRSHCLSNENEDNFVSKNDTGLCHKANMRNSTGVLNSNIHSSDKPKEVAHMLNDDEGIATSVVNGEEEIDHIYEGFEEHEGTKEQQENMKPTNNEYLTTEPKSASDTPPPKEDADKYQCNDEHKKMEALGRDLSHNDDNMHNVGEAKQDVEMEMTLQKHKETHLDETGKGFSLAKDNQPAERPIPMVRKSAARFQPDLTETPAYALVNRKSETDSEEFNNSDTIDNIQIIEAVKDPKDPKLLSNYINILPVESSMNTEREFSVSDQANRNEIQRDPRISNKDNDAFCDTIDKIQITETVEDLKDKQLHSNHVNILPEERSVNMDRHLRMSGQVKQNKIKGDARISDKNSEDICVGDRKEPEEGLLNSKPSETNSATPLEGEHDAKKDKCTDDNLEGYTIIENVLYGSLPPRQL